MSFATLSTLMGDRFGGCRTFYFDRRVRGTLLIRFLADNQMELMTLRNMTVWIEVAWPSDTG